MKKRLKLFRGLIAVFIVAMLLLPVGVALAEEFGVRSTVVTDTTYVLGDTYQRHTFNAVGLHWVFYSNDSAIVYTSSADAETWEVATVFDNYECDLIAENCCNGTVFALWYDLDENFVDVAWMPVADDNKPIRYIRGTPVNDGTITWAMAQTAVNASADLTYSHPSICVNTLDYPFIAYMVYNSSSGNYSGSVSTSTINTSLWTPATNSTINSETSLNISRDVYYPSVIPVTAGNVSIMVAFDDGSNIVLAQNYLDYDIDTDLWQYPAVAELPLPATTFLDPDDISKHSEVSWSGNLTNEDDIWAVATVNDSVLENYFWADRYGDPASAWSSDVALDTGIYMGSIGIRNALGDLVVTAIEITQKIQLYTADYEQASVSWAVLNAIEGVDGTSWEGTMEDYDNAGTDYTGSIYYDNNVAFSPDLEYGCYGCTPTVTPATIPASVTTMAWIVILVFGALLCLVLLAYGASESVKTGNTELAKIAGFGLIALIIAAIIVEALL